MINNLKLGDGSTVAEVLGELVPDIQFEGVMFRNTFILGHRE